MLHLAPADVVRKPITTQLQLFIYSCNSGLHPAVIKEQTMTAGTMVLINPLIHLLPAELQRSPWVPDPRGWTRGHQVTFSCSHGSKEAGGRLLHLRCPQAP